MIDKHYYVNTTEYPSGLVEVSIEGKYQSISIIGKGEGTTVHTALLAALDNYNRIEERVTADYDKPFRTPSRRERLLHKLKLK